jgi:hypothetical protein
VLPLPACLPGLQSSMSLPRKSKCNQQLFSAEIEGHLYGSWLLVHLAFTLAFL